MTGTQTLVAGRYRLVEPLGRGGMGTVWLARDEILHRDVAVKEVVPPPGLTQQEQEDLRRRTLREARAAARLNHPNVVRMYDVVDSPGAPWIVMEYVQGRSLQQVIVEDGPVPPARAARIGLDVLAALQASHAVGVEHRDVKPSNVLLAQDGRVVLTDFGLATAPGEATVTRPGLVLGSPAYISPERARGENGGPESDLWSLGATLYAAVEGKSPFDRSSPMATLTALATEDPPPPKRAGRLRRVLDGLLRKDPAERMSAAEVERLLRKVAGSDRPSALTQAFRRTTAPAGRPSPAAAAQSSASSAVVAVRPPAVLPAPAGGGAALPGLAASAAAPRVLPGSGSATETVPRRELPEVPRLPEHPSIGRAPVPVRPVPEEEPDTADRNSHRIRLAIAVLALLALGLAALALLGPEGQLPGGGTADPRGGSEPATSPASQPTPDPGAGTDPATGPTAGPTTAAPPAGQPPAGAPATRPPAQVPAPTPGSGGFTPPAGWRIYRDSTGFSVAVPSNWTVSRRGTIVYFDQPDGSRLLGIDITDEPKFNPVADWEAQEDYRVARGDFPDYERIKIVECNFFRACADWEFRYTRNGVRMHVNNRGFVVSDTRAHGIWWSTTDADWAASLAYLDVVFRSFRPAP